MLGTGHAHEFAEITQRNRLVEKAKPVRRQRSVGGNQISFITHGMAVTGVPDEQAGLRIRALLQKEVLRSLFQGFRTQIKLQGQIKAARVQRLGDPARASLRV